MKLAFIIALLLMLQQASFKETQLTHGRVKTAYDEKEATVKQYFADKKLSMEKFQLFLRAFKKEQILEVWIKEKNKEQFVLLHTYDFCLPPEYWAEKGERVICKFRKVYIKSITLIHSVIFIYR